MRHLTPIRVHFRDLDPYAHVNHSVYVTWFEIGRTTLLKEIGLPYRELEATGFRLPVLEVSARYALWRGDRRRFMSVAA